MVLGLIIIEFFFGCNFAMQERYGLVIAKCRTLDLARIAVFIANGFFNHDLFIKSSRLIDRGFQLFSLARFCDPQKAD